jgi:hypothetical protein
MLIYIVLGIFIGAFIFFTFFFVDKKSMDGLKAIAKPLEGEIVGSFWSYFYLRVSKYEEEIRIEITNEEKYSQFTSRRFLYLR